MVIGRSAGAVSSSEPRVSVITRSSDNSGSHFATGSVSASLPSSTSVIAAATVTGLVIEAMRNMVSRCIGRRGLDVAVAEFVDLQYLAGLPHQRDRPGQQARVDRLADGCLVAVEIHRRQRTQPRRKHFGRVFGCRLYAINAGKTTLESVANSDVWQLTGIGRAVIQRRSVARIEREVLR